MSGVFQNIDLPPPLSPPGECVVHCVPRLWCGGRTHSQGGEGAGGSIFWKTPGTDLYSTYVSTLWHQCISSQQCRRQLAECSVAYVTRSRVKSENERPDKSAAELGTDFHRKGRKGAEF
jgi:hypothetical protein